MRIYSAGENPSLILASDACTVSHIKKRRMGSRLMEMRDRSVLKGNERKEGEESRIFEIRLQQPRAAS
jgi:hypothetical protein